MRWGLKKIKLKFFDNVYLCDGQTVFNAEGEEEGQHLGGHHLLGHAKLGIW